MNARLIGFIIAMSALMLFALHLVTRTPEETRYPDPELRGPIVGVWGIESMRVGCDARETQPDSMFFGVHPGAPPNLGPTVFACSNVDACEARATQNGLVFAMPPIPLAIGDSGCSSCESLEPDWRDALFFPTPLRPDGDALAVEHVKHIGIERTDGSLCNHVRYVARLEREDEGRLRYIREVFFVSTQGSCEEDVDVDVCVARSEWELSALRTRRREENAFR